MKKSILFSWLGNADISQITEKHDGPIIQAIKGFLFERLELLCSYPQSQLESYVAELKKITGIKINIHPCNLSSPTEYGEIYNKVIKILKTIREKEPDTAFTYHLSPGTPAMATVWILIAAGRFPARLIDTSLERGVREVKLPFDIAAEYRPALQEEFEKVWVGLSEAKAPAHPGFEKIIYRSVSMENAVKRAHIISNFDVEVLLLGESGTGKELFARAIHEASRRADKPFIPVNCGAIPDELFESELFGYEKGAYTGAVNSKKGFIEEANGGTLFLDEIGEISLKAQIKLLRALQEKKITRMGSTRQINSDFRLICATNRNLPALIKAGSFREDFFHRIAVAVIFLPPLREREGDLGLLIDYYQREINTTLGKNPGWKPRKLSAAARKLLLSYDWPGNIRELINTLTRMLIWAQTDIVSGREAEQAIWKVQDRNEEILNRPIGHGFKLSDLIKEVVLHYFTQALEKTGRNQSKAAKLLGFNNYQTFNNWCTKYGIKSQE
jgi:transcriptional regulator with PAS, ATPase and Fis domain